MERPTTRTFVQRGERERLLEITWQGGEVEVSVGPRGKPGRVTERTFATPSERDAFIARRIQKALEEGFVERSSEEGPVSESPIDPEEARLGALRARHGTACYAPILAPGDPLEGSKFGGTPWLPATEPWPLCQACGLPMTFVLQLARAEAPEALRHHFASDLLQIFACTDQGNPSDPTWVCRADGSARGTAPSVSLRHVAIEGPGRAVSEALSAHHLEAWRRAGFEQRIHHWNQLGDRETAAMYEAKLAALPPIDARDHEVPNSSVERRMHPRLLSPAHQITTWNTMDEVPAYGDPLSGEEVEDLEEHFGLRCRPGHKLGGHPAWIQDPIRPVCCRQPMQFILQLDSGPPLEVGFGGDGRAYVFGCATCRSLAMVWQR